MTDKKNYIKYLNFLQNLLITIILLVNQFL